MPKLQNIHKWLRPILQNRLCRLWSSISQHIGFKNNKTEHENLVAYLAASIKKSKHYHKNMTIVIDGVTLQ